MIHDYIIIGGGSAGSVLTNRLSKDPSNKVLVLEAGRPDYKWDFRIHMPAALTYLLTGTNYNWGYTSDPEPYMHNRRVAQPRGKVLGGSSSINGMIWIRGNAMDFEKWAKDDGLEKWDYAHCLPYFKKVESRLIGADDYRGDKGNLKLTTPDCENPLFDAFFNSVQEAGYPLTDDVNGQKQEGFGKFDQTIFKSRRLNAARAYIHPIKHRKNLNVITQAMVMRILFEGTKAVGVEYEKGRKTYKVFAKEIICCGGAINTPQLLQVSGIGNAEHLTSLGIPVVKDLPGVGENLQDHLEVYIQWACKKPVSMYPALSPWRAPKIGFDWLFRKKGIGATNHFEAGGFIRSNEIVEYPNLQFHFLPLAIRYDGTAPSEGHGFQLHVGPMGTDVRGRVKIKSANPLEYPSILFNYLSTENERKEWCEAVRLSRKIIETNSMSDLMGKELSPGPEVQTDEEILDFIAKEGESAYHPCSTCKMGVDPMAVTDAKLRVHGIENLRVVDASVFPYVTNGNIYSPVMMVAEKAADLILGNTPLKPEDVPFENIIDSIIIVKDYLGSAYLPEWGFNGIGELDFSEGYQIKLTNSIEGFQFCPIQSIDNDLIGDFEECSLIDTYKDFPEGWSFLGYYCEESQDVADVLFDITDELIIVKDYLGAAYLPEWNFNGIGMFDYGEAYQIKLQESVTGLHLCPFFSTPE